MDLGESHLSYLNNVPRGTKKVIMTIQLHEHEVKMLLKLLQLNKRAQDGMTYSESTFPRHESLVLRSIKYKLENHDKEVIQ